MSAVLTALAARRQRRQVPLRTQFILLAALIALLAVALAIVGGSSYALASADLTAIEHNSSKVVAAQKMAAAVHRIDALLPELLLQAKVDLEEQRRASAARPGLPAALDSTVPVIEGKLVQFEDALFVAYSNTTAGRPDAATVGDRLMPSFRSYRAAVTGFLQALRYGQVTEADAAYRDATRILREQLRPALLRLDRLDRQDIDQSAVGAWRYLTAALGLIWGVGLLLVGLLGVTTWRLARTTRRLINPGLLPAFLVALGFLFVTGAQMAGARDLQAVAADSFESLHLTVQLQDELTAARAAQNAWLIQADSLAKDRTTLTPEQEVAAREASLSYDLAFGHADRQIRSMLSLAIAKAGEQRARSEEDGLKAAWQAYDGLYTQDQELRSTAFRDTLAAFALSKGPAQTAYQETWAAIDRVRQEAEDRFSGNLQAALADVNSAQPYAWGLYLGIAAFALWGVGMRLREF